MSVQVVECANEWLLPQMNITTTTKKINLPFKNTFISCFHIPENPISLWNGERGKNTKKKKKKY